MTQASTIPVEVAYALPDKQAIVPLQVPRGTTAQGAVALSGIEEQFPGLATAGADLGVFGKAVEPERKLEAGDRVEIYRPLLADPKEARKQRAAKAKEARKIA